MNSMTTIRLKKTIRTPRRMADQFIPKQTIEEEAVKLLHQYGRQYGLIAIPPIPIEEIVECTLDLSFEFDDLRGIFNCPDILGASWLEEKRVVVDQSLDPTVFPENEGRYRFTVAHEVGHWILHAPAILAKKRHPTLFDISDGKPSLICRSSSAKEPMEWQADFFAGHLLMPETMIKTVWENLTGNSRCMNVADEIQNLRMRFMLASEAVDPICTLSKDMAKIFKVSAQAMQIRLQNLNLLATKQVSRGMF